MESQHQQLIGKYRDIPVFISGSNYPVTKVENIQSEIEDLCKWIDTERKAFHPVEFAVLLHKKFVFIHPYKDGNGRVARLLMNTALIQDGYLPALIPPILRSEYIALLEKSSLRFRRKKVLDLGCGFGWHANYAIEKGVTKVVGLGYR